MKGVRFIVGYTLYYKSTIGNSSISHQHRNHFYCLPKVDSDLYVLNYGSLPEDRFFENLL